IRKLDRTPKQVLIEVVVAELSLTDENRLGLEWTIRTQQDVKIGGNSYNIGSVSRVDVGPPSTLPGSQPAATLPGIPVSVPETSVVLHDNQTLVLGGLIRTRRSGTRTGIPYLSKIPVIGFLFGATTDHLDRTELLLLITPRVVGDPSEAQEILRQLRKQRPEL